MFLKNWAPHILVLLTFSFYFDARAAFGMSAKPVFYTGTRKLYVPENVVCWDDLRSSLILHNNFYHHLENTYGASDPHDGPGQKTVGLNKVIQKKGLMGGVDYRDTPLGKIVQRLKFGNFLVVGAGKGRDIRIIKALVQATSIYAFEVVPMYLNDLRAFGPEHDDEPSFQLFGHSIGSSEIHKTDLPGNMPIEGFDLAVCTFGGYLEIHKKEKDQANKNIFNALEPGGIFALDLPVGPMQLTHEYYLHEDVAIVPISSDPKAPVLLMHPFKKDRPYGEVDEEAVVKSLEKAGFLYSSLVDRFPYKSESDPPQDRVMLFFKKPLPPVTARPAHKP